MGFYVRLPQEEIQMELFVCEKIRGLAAPGESYYPVEPRFRFKWEHSTFGTMLSRNDFIFSTQVVDLNQKTHNKQMQSDAAKPRR